MMDYRLPYVGDPMPPNSLPYQCYSKLGFYLHWCDAHGREETGKAIWHQFMCDTFPSYARYTTQRAEV